jgi:hypothetical protein
MTPTQRQALIDAAYEVYLDPHGGPEEAFGMLIDHLTKQEQGRVFVAGDAVVEQEEWKGQLMRRFVG